MEKHTSREEMYERIADDLTFCDTVYYDSANLQSMGVSKDFIFEYGEYLDIVDDDEFEKALQEEVEGGMMDFVRDLREAVFLPKRINAPESHEKFTWMEDFIEENRHLGHFAEEAERNLSRRHPFRNFKDTVYEYNLQKQWDAFEIECMLKYVRQKLSHN